MVQNNLDAMLADGFTKRMAQEYLTSLDAERQSPMFDQSYVEWAHGLGFLAESAHAYGLTDETAPQYLSDYDFNRLWPLNEWQRIWINDKLTLKYCLAGTAYDRYLPKYYYYTKPEGLMPLVDSTLDPTVDGLAAILREVGEIACKPCNGFQARGFHRLAFDGHDLLVDSVPVGTEGLAEFVQANPNYVLTEFIRPCAQLAAIDPLIHTLRVLLVNPDGVTPTTLASYLRFGMGANKTGDVANYRPPTEEDICSFNVQVDLATGGFDNGKLVYANRVVDAPAHPDSGVVAQGTLPYWDETLKMMHDVALRLGPVEYLGFDLGITEDGPKIMEINSHTGVKYLQLFTPLMAHEQAGAYFRAKLARVDALDSQARARRNGIVR